MMRHLLSVVVLSALAVLAISSPAIAQPAAPRISPPTVSPYLNLLRGNTSPTLNYYGLVRPEQQLRQSLQGVQSTANSNQANINDLYSGGGLAPTGVPGQFLNHGSYFLTQTGGGGTGGGSSGMSRIGGAMGGAPGAAGGGGMAGGARGGAASPRR